MTQTLAALNRDFFFLLDGGVLVAVFATAVATLSHGAVPRWYGYLSVAVGLISRRVREEGGQDFAKAASVRAI